MKRRKIYVIFMAVIMVLVSGCGSKAETGSNTVDSTEAKEMDETINETIQEDSAAYGDGVKHFLDKYYLEVTGYDEDCVYYTKWHN